MGQAEDGAVQATLSVFGHPRRRQLGGRWAEAIFQTGENGPRATLHLNGDGSGFVLLAMGDRTLQQITWENLIAAAATAAGLVDAIG
jgi:hypothetical protein